VSSPSSPMLEMQGSLEQLKQNVIPPFQGNEYYKGMEDLPKEKNKKGNSKKSLEENDNDDPRAAYINKGFHRRQSSNKGQRKSLNKGSRTGGGGVGIRMSRSSPSLSTSSSSIWRKIKQDSQENHQEHSNRNLETLSDVVSLVVGDGDDSINLQEE